MSDNLAAWETRIIRYGIFLVFLVTFGDYIFQKVWAVIGPLIAQAK